MQFRVLGPLEVSGEEGPITLGGPRQRAVLAHLIVHANKVVPADKLIDEVWGEEPPEAARNVLQTYISHLRKALGRARVEGRAPGYVLHLEPHELDAARFELLVQEAKDTDGRYDGAATLLKEALSLWRGPAFADLVEVTSLSAEVARLDELRMQALERRIDVDLASGRQGEVVGELESLTRELPLRERLWELLMLALYRSGRPADALAAYQRARDTLADELGIDPSPDLQRLYERILRQDPELELKGEQLRGYRLLEQIGEGAFGAVYRATQPQVGRDVAIKAVHPELANHPDFVRRFEREAQIVARLEHPHIVPLYDYWREPDGAYLVMRFLRGGSLETLLEAHGHLDPSRAATILDHVSAALAAAHRHDVVHRDVKPGNVLLDEEGNAYLTDFGVALDAGAPDRTSGTMVRGTPAYLSPEQIRLEPTSPRSDIYALGVVLYELLTGDHPFPESSLNELLDRHQHELLPSVRTLRPELPQAVDDVIARATAKDPQARFADALEVATAFRSAIEAPHTAAITTEMRNPYKGLRAFLEIDADDFYGRERVTDRLIRRLAEEVEGSRFLAVVGPSGSGKSSVVRAGLVPALRRGAMPGSERWYVIEMLPGARPLVELESAMLRVAVDPPPSLIEELERDELGLVRAVERVLPDPDAELVIVVDQLEEIFTLVPDQRERDRVLEAFRAAALEPDSRIRVVATLRADFFDEPLSVPGFGDLLAARTEAITPMSPEELERAIVAPAERSGLVVEPRLLAAVISDVAGRPGALPLLQYALTELAERHEDGVLTLDAYRQIDGVSGALAQRAEQLFEALNEEARVVCRQLFLRLVTLGEGGEDTRRRVRRSEVDSLADARTIEGVIEAFGRHRLLSFDRDPESREPTVEIAHESLLSAWSRLRVWIDEAREDIRIERQLSAAAREWETGGRDPSFLLRGARLEQIASWAETASIALSPLDRSYLEAAVRQRDEDAAAESARSERERLLQRRSLRRARALVAVFAVAALVAGTLTAVAVNRNATAERAVRLAAARELAGAASNAMASDPQLAALLALESIETTAADGVVDSTAELALRRAFPSLTVEGLGGFLEVSVTPDLGRVAIVGEKGPTGVWELAAGQPGRRLFTVPTEIAASSECPIEEGVRFPKCDAVFHAALSPDGALLATGHGDRSVRVWEVDSGRSRFEFDLYTHASGELLKPGFVGSPSSPSDPASALSPAVGFSTDGRYLWTQALFGDLVVWDVTNGSEVMRAPAELDIGSWRHGTIAFSHDSRFVAFGGLSAQVWDLEDRALVAENSEISFSPWPPLAFTRDGLVTDGVELWDLVGGTEDALPDMPKPEESFRACCHRKGQGVDLGFSPDGKRIALLTTTTVRVWDVTSLALVTLTRTRDALGAMSWSPDSRFLAEGGSDGLVRVWDVDSERVVVTIPTGPVAVVDLGFTQDGESLAIVTDDGVVSMHLLAIEEVIELARERVPRELTDAECQTYLHVPSCPAD